ncbi:TMEM175 family protein [Herbiconiux sp.]|uniref:TMEM175 family protein n=1 Tax=Herbiconiux sp. TaxID=1871186 RepID=UPI0025BD8AF1|nr:TMEM175 family protein [Herbiconiux sp.]
MSPEPGEAPESGVRRLVAFTDAVVAIAITLIVLPLVDTAQEGASSATDFLTANALGLGAAALSFVVIAAFWKDHHRLYQGVTRSTRALVNANLLWVAGIVFLPLPTVLVVSSPGHDSLAAGLYIGAVLVTQIAVRLQELILARRGLLPPGREPVRGYLWADWITAGLTALALAVTLSVPPAGLYPLLLMLLSWPINWLVRRGGPPEARTHRIL